jgi:hypothetical protein
MITIPFAVTVVTLSAVIVIGVYIAASSAHFSCSKRAVTNTGSSTHRGIRRSSGVVVKSILAVVSTAMKVLFVVPVLQHAVQHPSTP